MMNLEKTLAVVLAMALATPAIGIEQDVTRVNGDPEITRERIFEQKRIPVFGYEVVASYPHDTTSYTEGLVLHQGTLYEGTGRYGKSKLRQLDSATGHVIKDLDLSPRYFGEGVAVLDGSIYQLTYLSNTGFVYDQATFGLRKTFQYPSQGWGLTTNGERLIMSNGSSSIQFLDRRTLAVERQILVSDDVGTIGFLNELEYVDGRLFANVWQTDLIAIIDPTTGKVTGWIDLSGLNPNSDVLKYPYVLNGIAYNPATGNLLVTGKCWPNLYEIKVVSRNLQ